MHEQNNLKQKKPKKNLKNKSVAVFIDVNMKCFLIYERFFFVSFFFNFFFIVTLFMSLNTKVIALQSVDLPMND